METALFYIFAVIVLGSAAIVVFSKNVMYSAFSLLFTFFGVAALYVLLSADFLAITQIMIYIGGILILIIFGVMLTNKIVGVDIKSGTIGKLQMFLSAIVVLIVAVFFISVFTTANWIQNTPQPVSNSINPIGIELMTDYLLAFEVISVLLLIALVGAALIARRKHVTN
jgi:NADH-quinone oxidoreductase subunit J